MKRRLLLETLMWKCSSTEKQLTSIHLSAETNQSRICQILSYTLDISQPEVFSLNHSLRPLPRPKFKSPHCLEAKRPIAHSTVHLSPVRLSLLTSVCQFCALHSKSLLESGPQYSTLSLCNGILNSFYSLSLQCIVS